MPVFERAKDHVFCLRSGKTLQKEGETRFCQIGPWLPPHNQELSGTPNPRYFLKSNAGTNGRRTAAQTGGVLRCKNRSRIAAFPFFKAQKLARHSATNGGRTAVQTGGVLPVLFRQVVRVGGS